MKSLCEEKYRRKYSAISTGVFLVALTAATIFVNMPAEEFEPIVTGMIGGALLAQTAIILCQRFWNTVLWFAGFSALIVIATATLGYQNVVEILFSFVLTGIITIAGFGLHCNTKNNTATP